MSGAWDDEGDGADGRAEELATGAAASGVVAPDGAERGVASISSSPLRAQRDLSGPPQPGARGPGLRRSAIAAAASGAGTGRNLPIAIATGVGIGVVALACFKLGTVATLVLATVVATLSVAECYAALRRGGRRPATLLGLVATVAIMVAAYAKGPSALPLVLVLVVMTSMVWHLVGVDRGSTVEGVASTLLGFVWVGLLGVVRGVAAGAE